MRWLSRHQVPVALVLLVAVTWGALWVVYDYRSPISQFLRGVGTVQMDGWSAYDLDTECVRLEPATGTPTTTAENAIEVARNAYPGGYIREVLLVSFHDTCNGGERLAWAVAVSWTEPTAPAPTGGPRPRAIVLVDAISGQLIANHAEHAPAFIPSPSPSPSPTRSTPP